MHIIWVYHRSHAFLLHTPGKHVYLHVFIDIAEKTPSLFLPVRGREAGREEVEHLIFQALFAMSLRIPSSTVFSLSLFGEVEEGDETWESGGETRKRIAFTSDTED